MALAALHAGLGGAEEDVRPQPVRERVLSQVRSSSSHLCHQHGASSSDCQTTPTEGTAVPPAPPPASAAPKSSSASPVHAPRVCLLPSTAQPPPTAGTSLPPGASPSHPASPAATEPRQQRPSNPAGHHGAPSSPDGRLRPAASASALGRGRGGGRRCLHSLPERHRRRHDGATASTLPRRRGSALLSTSAADVGAAAAATATASRSPASQSGGNDGCGCGCHEATTATSSPWARCSGGGRRRRILQPLHDHPSLPWRSPTPNAEGSPRVGTGRGGRGHGGGRVHGQPSPSRRGGDGGSRRCCSRSLPPSIFVQDWPSSSSPYPRHSSPSSPSRRRS